jgi:hypothetical protein
MTGVEEAWQRHRRWSSVANRTRRSLDRWRYRNLALIIIGAVFGALAAQAGWFSAGMTGALGAAGAAALALAGLVQSQLLSADRVRTWRESRAASESLKAVVYQYLAGVAPFNGPDRDGQLAATVDAVQDRARSHLQRAMAAEPDTQPVPAISGIADYVTARAEEQANWHADRVRTHERLARRWRGAELAATGSAAVLAAAGGVLHGPDLSAWVAVATTIGAALAAHVAGAQHDRIAAAYASTADELQRMLGRFDQGSASASDAARFVADVERVLATQNQSWASLISQG